MKNKQTNEKKTDEEHLSHASRQQQARISILQTNICLNKKMTFTANGH